MLRSAPQLALLLPFAGCADRPLGYGAAPGAVSDAAALAGPQDASILDAAPTPDAGPIPDAAPKSDAAEDIPAEFAPLPALLLVPGRADLIGLTDDDFLVYCRWPEDLDRHSTGRCVARALAGGPEIPLIEELPILNGGLEVQGRFAFIWPAEEPDTSWNWKPSPLLVWSAATGLHSVVGTKPGPAAVSPDAERILFIGAAYLDEDEKLVGELTLATTDLVRTTPLGETASSFRAWWAGQGADRRVLVSWHEYSDSRNGDPGRHVACFDDAGKRRWLDDRKTSWVLGASWDGARAIVQSAGEIDLLVTSEDRVVPLAFDAKEDPGWVPLAGDGGTVVMVTDSKRGGPNEIVRLEVQQDETVRRTSIFADARYRVQSLYGSDPAFSVVAATAFPIPDDGSGRLMAVPVRPELGGGPTTSGPYPYTVDGFTSTGRWLVYRAIYDGKHDLGAIYAHAVDPAVPLVTVAKASIYRSSIYFLEGDRFLLWPEPEDWKDPYVLQLVQLGGPLPSRVTIASGVGSPTIARDRRRVVVYLTERPGRPAGLYLIELPPP